MPCPWMEWLDNEKRLVPNVTSLVGEFPSIDASGTHTAYLNLIDGNADLILVARDPSQDEKEVAAHAGVRLDFRPVTLDVLVFIVNQENPETGLTTEQIQDIYTGKLTHLQEIGSQASEIHHYQRDENSGS